MEAREAANELEKRANRGFYKKAEIKVRVRRYQETKRAVQGGERMKMAR